MAVRDEVRADALEQGLLAILAPLGIGDADQADDETERGRLFDIGGAQARNSFGLDGGEIDPRAERDRGEDRELVRGVDPFDVEGRIGLGIAERLRLLEHVGEIAARCSSIVERM